MDAFKSKGCQWDFKYSCGKDERYVKKIHTECGNEEESRSNELNISHCLIRGKNYLLWT